jgi:hypothetical protein
MVEYIPSYDGPGELWGSLPATRLARRKILIEQNIKKRTGLALCVLCGQDWGGAGGGACRIVYVHTVHYMYCCDIHN